MLLRTLPLRTSSCTFFFLQPLSLFLDLPLRRLPRDKLVLSILEGGLSLVVGSTGQDVLELLKLLDHTLVLLDIQEDAYALAVLVYHVARARSLTSSPQLVERFVRAAALFDRYLPFGFEPV